MTFDHLQCLCMTRCGHFVVIGYSSGDVAKFNMQSGLEYGGFGNDGKGKFQTVVNRPFLDFCPEFGFGCTP